MRQEQNIILIRNKHKLFMKETKLDQITSQESSLILNTAWKFLVEEIYPYEEIVDKKKLSKIFLKNKDKIEIVHFIGGG